MHFSVPCIIVSFIEVTHPLASSSIFHQAGVAARYENQRALVKSKLLSFCNTHIWILRGADFVPVLNYLWQGAAATGRAVLWEDYVNARCTILPIA